MPPCFASDARIGSASIMTMIYKIIDKDDWDRARSCGRYTGSQDDKRDGFIHFSTAGQMVETAVRHFAGQPNLMLLAIDADTLADALKWEASRNGQLFPHLYSILKVSSVQQSWSLPLDADGKHVFPEEAK